MADAATAYVPDDPVAAEAEILEGIRAGRDEAFDLLVRWQCGRMYAVARRIVRDDADAQDAVQEAFTMAFKAIDQFDGRAKLSTWLHRIVVNAALMKLRKQRRLREVSMDDTLPSYDGEGHRRNVGPAWEQTPDDGALESERERLVHEAIAQLPDSHRQIILLRDIEQYDTEQTAEMLGIRPGAVKTRLHRARQALRELLDPYMSGEVTP